MSNQHCIIVGASHAAAELCSKLRREGWQGRITLVGEEAYLPYNHPPLSKTFLAGQKSVHDLLIRHEEAYVKADIDCRLGTRAQRIDRDSKVLHLQNGETLGYDKLVLTTGCRVRKLDLPGSALANIFYLRSLHDAEAIRPHLDKGARALIIGGGYIGLECAAMLNTAGMRVTLLERDERILNRVAAPEISDFFTRLHREAGIEMVTGVEIECFTGESAVEGVACKDGTLYPADLVIVGVGVIPNTELAAEAGLEVSNGIVVNEFCESSDPDILAAGDCTWHFNKHYRRWMRLESIQNAVEQAETAAHTLCGERREYDAIPWFWSDQFDLKLQIAGLSEGYDRLIVRGDLKQGRKIAVFYFSGATLLAVDAVNSPQEFMFGKRALAQNQTLDTERLADMSVSMRELVS